MRARIALLALLAVAASRGHCGGTPPYEPCLGRACGETCRACPPNQPCVETAVLTACDPAGRCVPAVDDLCGAARDACLGKACGEECVVEPACRASTPPCLMPSIHGRCDAAGQCTIGDALGCVPVTDCTGQACGVPCQPCGGMCMHPYASACDLWGQCAPVSSWICWDPCAGKACGAECHHCPLDAVDCAETLELKACDPSGRCVSRTPELVCP